MNEFKFINKHKDIFLNLLWLAVALLSVTIIEGYTGWVVFGLWLVITSVYVIYKNNRNNHTKASGIQTKTDSYQSNFIAKSANVVIFYVAQLAIFSVTLEPHEIEWWMHLFWLSNSMFFAMFFNDKGFINPFKGRS